MPKESVTEYVVDIERLVPGGAGLGRLTSGEVVFVPGALPGDRVRVVREARRAGVRYAEEFNLVTPSLERVVPPCRVHEACGGCDLMALNLEAQRRAKLDILTQALRRTGGIEAQEIGWIPSDQPFGYRERVRLHVLDGQLGFHQKQSNRLVPVASCEVAHPRLNAAIADLNSLLESQPEQLSGIDSLELRALTRSSLRKDSAIELLVQLSPTAPRRAARSRGSRQSQPGRSSKGSPTAAQPPLQIMALLKQRWGNTATIRYASNPVPPERTYVSDTVWTYARPGTFSQVNPHVNRQMINLVVEQARATGARTFLDLYCGSGNFTLPLLELGLHGLGIELNPEAIELARTAVQEQRTKSWGAGEFKALDSARFMHGLRASAEGPNSYDLVIVDPPRAGAKPILERVAQLCANTLVMISCDPVTLARDLKVLLTLGLQLESVCACDMFPQTHHLETVAILKKSA